MKPYVMSTTAVAAAIFALGNSPAALAQYAVAPPLPLFSVAVVPPHEALTIVRSMGFAPISRPVLRGAFYVVRAVEEDRLVVRVVVDGRYGRVVRVTELGDWQGAHVGVATAADPLPPATPQPGTERAGMERIPLPRPAPPQARIAANTANTPGLAAAMTEPDTKPGKSVPAPVADRAPEVTGSVSKSASAGDSASPEIGGASATEVTPAKPPSRSAGGLQLKPTEMIPVAPLE